MSARSREEQLIPNIGPMEIAIVLIIALIVFGPKKLPELGKSVGQGLKEFRTSMSASHDEQAKESEPVITETTPKPKDETV